MTGVVTIGPPPAGAGICPTGSIEVVFPPITCDTNSIAICPGDDPIVVVGTVELGSTTLAALETITVLQGTSPWVISGTVTSNQGTSPWVIGDGGGSITVDGTVAVTQSTSPWVVSGTVTADTNFDYPEDSAHISGNPGAFVLAVRNDAGTPLASDGDYIPFTTDSTGALRVNATFTGEISVALDCATDSVTICPGDDPIIVSGTVELGATTLAALETITVLQGTSPWVIGDGGGSITVDGTVISNQGTSPWVIGDGGGSITVDGTVAISGTVAVTQSTSPWVVSGTVTADTNFDYPEDSPHVSADVGAFVLAVRNDAGTPLAGNGDYIPFTTDASGSLRVTIAGGSSVTQTGRDDTDNQAAVATGLLTAVDRNYIWDSVGGNWDRWTGAVTVSGTVTVNQGTSPWVTSLDAPTLAALESITVQNPGGAAAVNIQDGGNSITVDGAVAVSGTVTADTNFDYAEDSPHVSGDPGAFVLAVRNDANAAMTNTNGDYSPIAVNANGAVAINDGGNSITVDGTVAVSGTVAVTQSTSPWVVSGTVTVNQGTSPWVVSGTVASTQSGAWSVTILNGAGVAAVNIQDGGNSITVDGSVSITGSVTTADNKVEDVPHVSGDTGSFILAVRNDANAALTNTNGDYSPVAVNSAGAIAINDGGNSITVDGTVAISGTVAVTQSTSPWVCSLDATTLAALESITVQNPGGASAVNIQDGGNSITVDGTVSISGTVAVTQSTSPWVVSGTVATNSERAEDSGHTSGQIGNFVLGVRNDTASVLTSTDLDYTPFATDSAGRIGISDLGGAISIDDNGGSITVDGTVAVSGTVAVTQSTSPWVVSGTVAATQSGSWSVTILNGAGAAAVNIQDGGNSITVDGTVAVSGTVTVIGNQTPGDTVSNPTDAVDTRDFLEVWNGTTWDRVKTPSVDIANANGVISVGGYLYTGGGTAYSRIREFPTSDAVVNTGIQAVGMMVTAAAGATSNRVRDPSTDAIGVGLVAAGNMGFNGSNWDRIRSGGDDTDNQTASSLGILKTIGRSYIWDSVGGNWDRWTGAVTVTSGTVTVNQGTSPWVTSNNNGAGAAAVNIQDGGNSITVDGTVSVTQPTGTITNGAETAVTGTAVQILAANANRKKYIIQNTGTANIRVGTTGVTATTGVRLIPSGTLLFEMPNCPTQAIFAIREGATSSIALAQEIT